MQTIGQNLYGVVMADVGGGIPKIEEAFLTKEYKDQHQDETGLIDELAE